MGCCEGWCNNNDDKNEKENEIVSGNDKKVSQYKNNNQKTFKNEKENEIINTEDNIKKLKKELLDESNNQKYTCTYDCNLNKGELMDENKSNINSQNNADITFGNGNTIFNNIDIDENKNIKKEDFKRVVDEGTMGGAYYYNNYLYSFHKDLVLKDDPSVFFNYNDNDHRCYISNFKMGTIEGQELESVEFYGCHSQGTLDGKNYQIFGIRDPNGNVAYCLISFNKEANKDLIERLEQNKEKKDNTYNNYDRRDIDNDKIKKNISIENNI